MSTELDTADHGTRLPTRTSTVLSVVVGLGVIGLLCWQIPLVVGPVIAGSVGALCLAASLWLVGRDRWGVLARAGAGLLTLPVTLGLFAALIGTVLAAVDMFLPVRGPTTISLLSLTLVTHVGVVVGCVLAVLGLTLGVRNVIDGQRLADHYWLTIQTALVPATIGALLATGAFLTKNTTSLDTAIVGDTLGWLFAPGTGQTHLMSSLALVAIMLAAVRAVVDALPVAELLADSGTGETEQHRVSQLLDILGRAALLTGVAALIALSAELLFPPTEFRRAVSYETYQLLVDLSTIPLVRFSAVAVSVLCLGIVGVVSLLQRLAANSADSVLQRVGPFGAGILLAATSLTIGGPLLENSVRNIGRALPSPASSIFFGHARELLYFFGPPTLALLFGALLVAVAATMLLVLRFAVFAGYLSDETAGYSLASGGLIVAAAFAGTIVSAPWVLFTALVGGLFVWDMGRYGTTLGKEIGRHAPTRDTELVHAGGTLAVGLVGAGSAYAIQRLLSADIVQDSPAAVVALAGVLAGIVLLVAALR